MQTSHLNPRRDQGTIALVCFTFLVVIIILGVTYYIVVQTCKNLPRHPCAGCDTNDTMTATLIVPASAKSLDQTYRLVLQRKVGTNDWDDLASADWGGAATTFGVTTNWTDLGLFRVKAIPSQ